MDERERDEQPMALVCWRTRSRPLFQNFCFARFGMNAARRSTWNCGAAHESEKISIANIDTPEIEGRCSSESAAAIAAKDYLARLLNGQMLDLIRGRLDKYGRQLATVSTASGDVGEMIIRAGLARRWQGHRDPWC